MSQQLIRSILLAANLLAAPYALGDDSVANTKVWNTRSDSITVYWTAMGCAGIVNNKTFVCHSVSLGPGESAEYTWLWGQTKKTVDASCSGKSGDAGWDPTPAMYVSTDTPCKSSKVAPPVATTTTTTTVFSGRYFFVNKVDGLCLDPAGYDAASTTDVGLFRCDGGLDQAFGLDSSGKLLNAKSGICLDVAGYQGNAGDDVGLYTCDGHADQTWTLFIGGWGTIGNQAKNLCLEAEGNAASGANVQINTCDNSDRQKWTAVQIP